MMTRMIQPFRSFIGVLAALSVLMLGACASAVDDLAVPIAPSVSGIQLTETGIGLVDQSTRYNSREITAALDGARVETVQATSNGRITSLLAAFAPSGLQMLRFENSGGRVGAIHVVSEDVPGPRGERIGQTYAQAGGSGMRCQPGTDTWVGMAVCRRDGSAITYVFAVPLRSSIAPLRGSELRQSNLTRMVWRP